VILLLTSIPHKQGWGCAPSQKILEILILETLHFGTFYALLNKI